MLRDAPVGSLRDFALGDLDDYRILLASESLINPSDRVFTKVFRGLYVGPPEQPSDKGAETPSTVESRPSDVG